MPSKTAAKKPLQGTRQSVQRRPNRSSIQEFKKRRKGTHARSPVGPFGGGPSC
jgi:hypothetical protein